MSPRDLALTLCLALAVLVVAVAAAVCELRSLRRDVADLRSTVVWGAP